MSSSQDDSRVDEGGPTNIKVDLLATDLSLLQDGAHVGPLSKLGGALVVVVTRLDPNPDSSVVPPATLPAKGSWGLGGGGHWGHIGGIDVG